MRVRSHPGEILSQVWMKGMGISCTELAKALDVNTSTVSRLISGKSSMSFDMAKRLSKCLGTSWQMWINLQNNYDNSIYTTNLDSVKVLREPDKNGIFE